MMESENSKSKEHAADNSAIREFPDHPRIVNDDGLVIDCVLEDYPDPPRGTVETLLKKDGLLIDFVDIHQLSLQRGYKISLKRPSFQPDLLKPTPGSISIPVDETWAGPEDTLPVVRRKKNYKPPPEPPREPLPPYVEQPELQYHPGPPTHYFPSNSSF